MNDIQFDDFEPLIGFTIGQHRGVGYRVECMAKKWAFQINGRGRWRDLHKTKRECIAAAKGHIDKVTGDVEGNSGQASE